jgi:hypothetical protein
MKQFILQWGWKLGFSVKKGALLGGRRSLGLRTVLLKSCDELLKMVWEPSTFGDVEEVFCLTFLCPPVESYSVKADVYSGGLA